MRNGRTSHEVRGLKYALINQGVIVTESHLTRGAWIEILPTKLADVAEVRRTSHEVRGLKYKLRR